jgi:PAT family beta-lactamase induction signal transducer AmpG
MGAGAFAFLDAFRSKRVGLCIALGFASGLPFEMRGLTLTTWMTNEGVNLRTIGLFTYVGLFFTLKPLWAPLLDRYQIPILGRRRGWMLVLQLALMLSIAAMGTVDPRRAPLTLAALAALASFLTATHDTVNDAYRADVLLPGERASGSATFTMGYRIANLVAGAGALILTDVNHPWHLRWSTVYPMMATLMIVAVVATWLAPEPPAVITPRTLRAAVVEPLVDLFARRGAVIAFAFIMLYKFGDYMLSDMSRTFLIRSGFSNTEIAGVQKAVGMVATIVGALLGAGFVNAIGVRRSLLVFGVLQAAMNSGYLALAVLGKHHGLLVATIAADLFCAGLAQTAFSAYQLSLCSKRFSATQFALIASASTLLGRLAGGVTGYLIEAVGWAVFFAITMVVAIPGLLLIVFGRLERAAVPVEPPATTP